MFRHDRVSFRARAGVVAALAAGALLAACGPRKGPEAEVAAKVNGQDITVAEVGVAAAAALRQRDPNADSTDAAGRAALDRLIESEILAQKAIATKLDQDPRVVAQLADARRDILARRFVDEVASQGPKVDDRGLQKFYDDHPAQFAQRRLYTLQQLEIQAPEDRRAEVVTHVGTLKSPGELSEWLKAQGLQVKGGQMQSLGDRIPPAIADKLAKMKDGESAVVSDQGGRVAVVTLVSSSPAPQSFAEARPAIQQALDTQVRREAIGSLQKNFKDGAKIEYIGRFAMTPSDAPPPSTAAPVVADPAPASTAASAASQNLPAQK